MKEFLDKLRLEENNYSVSTGLNSWNGTGEKITSFTPVDGSEIGSVNAGGKEDFEKVLQTAQAASLKWRRVPAPKRGDIVRQMGDAFRENKDALGRLVSYEMGKSLQEGWGEVQEMIDICDFAVGLSRQLYGFTM
ncbi:MAG: aldehyde dehydrogenase (NAD+), partial [Spirosomataceae bacterium]